MKTMKRLLAIFLSVIMVASVMIIPASAVTADTPFHYFPRVNGSMANTYSPAAVAVQRVMMLFNTNYRSRLAAAGGTDGLFGEVSVDVAKDFQVDIGVKSDGDIWHDSWDAIYWIMTVTGVDSVGTVYSYGMPGSATTRTNWVLLLAGGYYAYTQDRTPTTAFYPTN